MRIETVLNHCYRHKSFVYSDCHWGQIGGKKVLIVDVVARKNGMTECSICGKVAPLYDCLEERRFDFVPLWNIPVYFQNWMRRVKCPEHGVRVEWVPWADGKSHLTKPYVLFLSRWARKLSWKETAESFGTTWDNVYRSVKERPRLCCVFFGILAEHVVRGYNLCAQTCGNLTSK